MEDEDATFSAFLTVPIALGTSLRLRIADTIELEEDGSPAVLDWVASVVEFSAFFDEFPPTAGASPELVSF